MNSAPLKMLNSLQVLCRLFSLAMLFATHRAVCGQNARKMARSYFEQTSPAHDKNRELLCAAKEGDLSLVKVLLAKGASIDAADGTGLTSLMHAAGRKDAALTDFLLRSRAAVGITNTMRQTALHRAVIDTSPSQIKRAVKVIQLLLSAGASIDSIDAGGFTPLDYALKKSPELVQALLEHERPVPPRNTRTSTRSALGAREKPTGLPPDVDTLFTLDERTMLYGSCEASRWDQLTSLLINKALQQSVANRYAVKEAYDFFIQRLLPGVNMLLRDCLPYFGRYTHVQKICTIDPWRDSLMLIFFDELEKGVLPDSDQVSQARVFAVTSLAQSIVALHDKVKQLISRERPALLTAEVVLFLERKDPGFYKVSIGREIDLRMTHRTSSPATKSIFERIEFYEQQDCVPKTKPRALSPDVF